MKHKRAAIAVLTSVFTMSGMGVMTAEAAQNQQQVTNTDQRQTVIVTDDSTVNQQQDAQVTANESESMTPQNGQVVQGTYTSNATSTQKHTAQGPGFVSDSDGDGAAGQPDGDQDDDDNPSQTSGTDSNSNSDPQPDGSGIQSSQQQNSDVKLTMTKTGTKGPSQSTVNVRVHQQGTATTVGHGTQSDNMMLSEEQTTGTGATQKQTVVTSGNTTATVTSSNSVTTSANTNPYDYSWLLPSKSTFSQTQVVGYAIFDKYGNLLSDSYGIFPSGASNGVKQYDVFTTNQPTVVYVKPVNAWGQPVANPTDTVLYLRSNNYNSVYFQPSDQKIIRSIEMPAGATSVPISYVNVGAGTNCDVLDVGTDDPTRIIRPTAQAMVNKTSQSQTATSSTVTASQAQTSNTDGNAIPQLQIQDVGTQGTQSQSATQTTKQTQSVVTAGGDAVSQEEDSAVSGAQTETNTTPSQSGTVAINQTETGSTTNPVTLSQQQSVTAIGSVINVTFTQNTPTVDSSSNVTLSQGITLSVGQQGGPGQTVNYTIGNGPQKQITIGVYTPLQFGETQQVNTSNVSSAQSSIYVEYTQNGQDVKIALA